MIRPDKHRVNREGGRREIHSRRETRDLDLGIAQNEESDFEMPACTVSEIVKGFTLSAPTICHHLKELVNADLIATERAKHVAALVGVGVLRSSRSRVAFKEGGWPN